MRFMIMHKTNAHWEAGAIPSPELIARVGEMIGEIVRSGALLAADGLRASSQGVRLQFCLTSSGGKYIVTDGPFTESKELIAGFVIIRSKSMQQALEWVHRYAAAVGADEIDVRLVSEGSDRPH
jgi:hypothetical protein